ncbi:MAG: hypothetical protein NVS1B4_07660 [Gemmatimonadaceae bacterium]
MRHAIRFEGGFERNFADRSPGAADFEGDDGARHPLPAWPADVTGLRFGFMEQPGKRFVAVRVRYEEDEILLGHPVRIDPDRHLGGKRFAAEPVVIADNPAGSLLGDILDANPSQATSLSALRERVRSALKAVPAH